VDAGQRLEMRREAGGRVYGLYVIIDPQVTSDRDPLEVARAALEGGAHMLQLRDKVRDKGRSLPLAAALRELCDRYGALLMVNDHADVAALSAAHGLHVGQTDLPVAQARRVLGPRQIVGRSNHLLSEVMESEAQGADHVALGNIYRTSTKESIRDRPPLGPEAVTRAKAAVSVPLVAIGGINEDNVDRVVRAGADAVCVASAVGLAPDPAEASRRMTERMRRAGGKV
jgi:thiamine-phosphate pyrophosphorylase